MLIATARKADHLSALVLSYICYTCYSFRVMPGEIEEHTMANKNAGTQTETDWEAALLCGSMARNICMLGKERRI